MSATYLTMNGMIVHENRSGVQRDYVPDTQGSTAALVDNTQTLTDQWEYWPYGEVSAKTGTSATPFSFVGTLGYFSDHIDKLSYVRARNLRVDLCRWLTIDPQWPEELSYVYVADQPSSRKDPTGLGVFKCERCAAALFLMYKDSKEHECCHCFIHCLVCCILNHEFDAECARGAQGLQNNVIDKGQGIAGFRNGFCEKGIRGNANTSDCAKHCRQAPGCECDNAEPSCFPPVSVPKWPLHGHLPDFCYDASPILRYCIFHPVYGIGG
jgi:RHS repeat-associated protein